MGSLRWPTPAGARGSRLRRAERQRLDQLEAGLAALGKRLVIEMLDAA
jgi:hypothetical protein